MTKPNILPADLQDSLQAVGRRLEKFESVAAELPAVLEGLFALPASSISQAAPEIAAAAKLYRRQKPPSLFRNFFQKPLSDKEQLLDVPDLQYLFVFHADGWIREAALKRMVAGLPSPFMVAALAFRLNDWVEPVRKAAVLCANRCFPLTAPQIMADGIAAMVVRQQNWRRWGDESEALDEALTSPDIAKEIASLICISRTGPASQIFRFVLKTSAIDPYLPHLATNGLQPAVRAMAVQMIADNRASWPVGWEWKWLDKSMGRRQRIPKFAFRDLIVSLEPLKVLHAAASDRSAIVRRGVLTALIQHHLGSKDAENIALRLKGDLYPSVRERAEFILSRSPATATGGEDVARL